MSMLKRAAQRFYAPSGGGDPWTIPSNGSLAAYTASGVPVTDETALQLLAVAACVRLLSDAVSGLPFDSVKADGEIRKTVEPPPAIVADPFGGSSSAGLPTRREGFSQMMVSLLLRGNAYCLVLARDTYNRPIRLRVIHPDRVRCEFDKYGVRKYEIDRQSVPSEDVVHLMGMALPEAPTGMSVISYARQAIGLGLAAEEFGARFFGEGAHMTGVVEIDADLDVNRARQIKENFSASHSGLKNSHTVGVLSGGAKWKPISVSPEDAQFLGTRAAQNLDIAMIFGIPPHMLGQVDKTTSWGTGIEQQGLGFLAYTLGPWLGRFEDAWSTMLPKPQSARFNADALLRTDTAGRYAVYTAARSTGILTVNEIRALENYAPVDGGDDIAMPLNSSAPKMKDNEASPTAPKADALGAVL
ncbi:phage portal protein [Streptomyces sp. WI03-4A]|uniref:phage portal protein n=1 Tax=Streptomyces sp. WI03-4A TaxID=3028706 RepID=UPI0029BE561C|nr:phage portal protein [Streptomyces sp. WI03-4A]MDX2590992.1 phage portal protein [Streptomyces sp. WI03-4A]